MEVLRRISHAENVKVLQAALVDVHKPVVAVRISRNKEKAVLKDKVTRVADNALDHLVILKVNPHPQPRNDWRVLVEVKRFVTNISVKGLDEENGLRLSSGDLLHFAGINQVEPNCIERGMRIVTEELFDRAQLTDLSRAANGAVIESDHDTIDPLGRRRGDCGYLCGYARS